MESILRPSPQRTRPAGNDLPGAALRLLVLDPDPDGQGLIEQALAARTDRRQTAVGSRLLKPGSTDLVATFVSSTEEAHELLVTASFHSFMLSRHGDHRLSLAALETLREICEVPPTVLLAEGDGENLARDAMRAGIADYVTWERVDTPDLDRALERSLQLARLEREMIAKEQALQESVEALRARQEEVDSFYHNVSHELKTPLTGAREFVSLVQDGTVGKVGRAQHQLLSSALRNFDMIAHCLNDMLDAARLETGKMILNPSRSDFCAVIRDAIDCLRAQTNAKCVRILTGVSGNLAPSHFDRHRIFQATSNLISHAVRFSPPNGLIRVEVSGASKSHVEVTVTDSGPSIKDSELACFFDRLPAPGNPIRKEGVSLGLYLSRRIVELHGGDVWVERAPTSGIVLGLRIPRQTRVSAVLEPLSSPREL
ncbi:MAG: ATP-binding protein [Planctomycetota bacterium]